MYIDNREKQKINERNSGGTLSLHEGKTESLQGYYIIVIISSSSSRNLCGVGVGRDRGSNKFGNISTFQEDNSMFLLRFFLLWSYYISIKD